jgi:hypothetical protein
MTGDHGVTAQTILNLVEIWCLIGFAVGAVFLFFGIHRVDEDADGAVAFRPLLIIGIMLIWPLVLWRWYVLATGQDNWKRRHRPPRATHLYAALFMAVAIVMTAGLSMALKQTWPANVAPERLSDAGDTQ